MGFAKALATVLMLISWSLISSAQAQSRQYLMFFDFEKPQLTPSVVKHLAPVKDATKSGSRIDIVGYCDTAEKNPAKLSLARARDVEKRLRALGLPQGVQITVKGSGAGETLVKSGPNAREPQNRVAIITIK